MFFFLFVVDINKCGNNPCRNGAECSNVGTDYTCDCPAGFTDKDCETSKYGCGLWCVVFGNWIYGPFLEDYGLWPVACSFWLAG